MMCRRTVLKGALTGAACGWWGIRTLRAAAPELRLSDGAATERWDFERHRAHRFGTLRRHLAACARTCPSLSCEGRASATNRFTSCGSA